MKKNFEERLRRIWNQLGMEPSDFEKVLGIKEQTDDRFEKTVLEELRAALKKAIASAPMEEASEAAKALKNGEEEELQLFVQALQNMMHPQREMIIRMLMYVIIKNQVDHNPPDEWDQPA